MFMQYDERHPGSSLTRPAVRSAGFDSRHGLGSAPDQAIYLDPAPPDRNIWTHGSLTSSSRSSAPAARSATSSPSERNTSARASANTGYFDPKKHRCTPSSVTAISGKRTTVPAGGSTGRDSSRAWRSGRVNCSDRPRVDGQSGDDRTGPRFPPYPLQVARRPPPACPATPMTRRMRPIAARARVHRSAQTLPTSWMPDGPIETANWFTPASRGAGLSAPGGSGIAKGDDSKYRSHRERTSWGSENHHRHALPVDASFDFAPGGAARPVSRNGTRTGSGRRPSAGRNGRGEFASRRSTARAPGRPPGRAARASSPRSAATRRRWRVTK